MINTPQNPFEIALADQAEPPDAPGKLSVDITYVRKVLQHLRALRIEEPERAPAFAAFARWSFDGTGFLLVTRRRHDCFLAICLRAFIRKLELRVSSILEILHRKEIASLTHVSILAFCHHFPILCPQTHCPLSIHLQICMIRSS